MQAIPEYSQVSRCPIPPVELEQGTVLLWYCESMYEGMGGAPTDSGGEWLDIKAGD